MSRRELIAAGAAAGLADDQIAPRIDGPVRIGFVGVGARGTGLLETVLSITGVEIPAVCDVDADRARNAQALVQKARGLAPETYTRGSRDYERLCARDDLHAVITATPWEWHTPVCVAAMRAGKVAGTEVPACLTMEECWELVNVSRETGRPCMMLENVNYFQDVLALLRMVNEGVLGEMLHVEAGYQHDVRFLAFTDEGRLTWRGNHFARLNGNLYPTHPVGPAAWWLGINRGDRFTQLSSLSTPAIGLREWAKRKFGPDHALSRRKFAQGDVNTTLLRTAKGRTLTLYFDCCTPRAYDLIFRVQGTKGIWEGGHNRVYIEGVSPTPEVPEPTGPYLAKYAHPLWTSLEAEALKNGGHGGCDYIVIHEFVRAIREGRPLPQDVYDAATWSAIVPLSIQSVAKSGAVVPFPDFSKGAWRSGGGR